MNEEEWRMLFSALEKKGWFWDEGILYATHKTIWLCGGPWPTNLVDMKERMRSRLLRLHKNIQWVGEEQTEKMEDDTASLVETLESLQNNSVD